MLYQFGPRPTPPTLVSRSASSAQVSCRAPSGRQRGPRSFTIARPSSRLDALRAEAASWHSRRSTSSGVYLAICKGDVVIGSFAFAFDLSKIAAAFSPAIVA